uniref:Myb-like domain-containing protein n=1 Tax=viral metagenome TaxID=1070528 RepID=A0A6C0KT40_9ZZZZ
MESPMLKMLKSKNPDKEYPSNTGQKWTDEEEILLLEELSKNIDIQLIAQYHNRTSGGINARRREIAYKLYNNNNSMEEIILKTKLDEDQIIETIKKLQNNPKKCKSVIEIKKPFSIESEIGEIKNDIKELKNTIKELVEMMKAVYEFEDA